MMVEVTKRPDRRPPSLVVYRRLTACLPSSDPISQLTSVHAQILIEDFMCESNIARPWTARHYPSQVELDVCT